MSVQSSEFAHIGKSVSIKGEISGNEDVYIDGQVEGTIQLSGNRLTIGPNGNVHADVTVQNVIVGGTLQGNIHAGERTEFRKTAVVNGDIRTRRIAIEEGAYFQGKLEILSDTQSQPNPATAVAASASQSSPASGIPGHPK